MTLLPTSLVTHLSGRPRGLAQPGPTPLPCARPC